eukprot:CAMPEP_0179114254 /NCGR_PEP_ID=MMETSP0796-20121207/53490_1 /TAXON_ID=73915 /ORGANISM="Pyrodinium bahamense, Strain pbaha01" /LENGTH=143 /DNA_ID=CAMNT_0020812469 /DNA_START=161 /DNA_END=592 /DNA_ORIENTATION=+
MSIFDSLGFLWAFVTAVLGFKPFRHEGKLTGLAGHGNAARTLHIFEGVMRLEEEPGGGRWRIRTSWHEQETHNFQLYLAGLEDRRPLLSDLESFKLCVDLRIHEQPILCRPCEAVTAFEGGACDVLAMYPYLLRGGALNALQP